MFVPGQTAGVNKPEETIQIPTPQAQPQRPVAQPQPQPQQQAYTAPSYQPSAFDLYSGPMFGAIIPPTSGSEYLIKFKEVITKIFLNTNEEMRKRVRVDVIAVDNQVDDMFKFSSILVAVSSLVNPGIGVFFHTLILEATSDPVVPFTDTNVNPPVEVTRVTSDAYDRKFVDKAIEIVARNYAPGTKIRPVDSTVIPRDFNPENENNMQLIAMNAGLAAMTEIETIMNNGRDITIADVLSEKNLSVNIGYQQQPVIDIVGSPVRSDITVTFMVKRGNSDRNNTSLNSGNQDLKLLELSSFVDLLWAPVSQQGSGYYGLGFQPQQNLVPQKFMPRVVITNITSTRCYTLATILLAIGSPATMLANNRSWYGAFKPNLHVKDRKQVDLRDIGALNYEGNLEGNATGRGEHMDIRSESVPIEKISAYIDMLVRPGIALAIDCPDSAPQSWYTSIFRAASEGDVRALRAIYESADKLTNGIFSTIFKTSDPMFIDKDNRIHNGHYIDNNGQKRDIRDIDYLAVCNINSDRDIKNVIDFSDTFLQTNYPLNQRLFHRKRMINNALNDGAVFTGFSTRVTFSAEFTGALRQAIETAGLRPQLVTPHHVNDFNNQRGEASFADRAVISPVNGYQGASAGVSNAGFYRANVTRWT
jgi:hypothetical protein